MIEHMFNEHLPEGTSSNISEIATNKADEDALIAKCPSSFEDLFANMDADYIILIGPFDYASFSAEMVQKQSAEFMKRQDTQSDLVGGLLTGVFNLLTGLLSPILVISAN